MLSVQVYPDLSIISGESGAHISLDVRFEAGLGLYSASMSGVIWIEIDLPGGIKYRTSTSISGVWNGGKEILDAIAAFARQNKISDIQLRGPATFVEAPAVKRAFGVDPTFL